MTTAVILAGGLGTRLRDAVPDLPKPMAPVSGRPFLEYLMSYWQAQGITRFILSVGYKHDIIQDHFGEAFNGTPVEYVVEDTPLGTGGGLVLALDRITGSERFLVLNGDTFFRAGLDIMGNFAETNDAEWCFAVFRDADTARYMGMQVSPEGKILALKYRSDEPTCLVNGGVYLVDPKSLRNRFKPDAYLSLEDEILTDALASGQRLYALECQGDFIDIGIPADYHHAPQILIK